MAFTPFPWKKGPSGKTPLNPTNLNKAEEEVVKYVEETLLKPTWTEVTEWKAGFVQGTTAIVRVAKVGSIVHIVGFFEGESIKKLEKAFLLPVGYRPEKELSIPVVAREANVDPRSLLVKTTGVVEGGFLEISNVCWIVNAVIPLF